MSFSITTASPQSEAERDQKRKKSVKQPEKIAQIKTISTGSESESFDACKGKETLLPKIEKTEYSEVKHQPQSVKIRKVTYDARKE